MTRLLFGYYQYAVSHRKRSQTFLALTRVRPLELNHFWQKCFLESRQLKDGINSQIAWSVYCTTLQVETWQLHFFTQIMCVALLTNTENASKLSTGHRKTARHSQNYQMHSPNNTRQDTKHWATGCDSWLWCSEFREKNWFAVLKQWLLLWETVLFLRCLEIPILFVGWMTKTKFHE